MSAPRATDRTSRLDRSLKTFDLFLVCVLALSGYPQLLYSDDEFSQRGSDIDGETAGDASGRVSLSSDGSIVAIGAPTNDGNGSGSGHLRVYN